jgi:hypothetical protein
MVNHEYCDGICSHAGFRSIKSLMLEVLNAVTTMKEVNKLPAMHYLLMTVMM